MEFTYEEQIKRVNEKNPFMAHNGIRAVSLTETEAEVSAEISPQSLNAMGGVHGGLLFAAAEMAAGLATRNDGRRYVTLDSSFRFLNGAKGSCKEVQAKAEITKRGRTVAFTKAKVFEPESGKLLGEGEFTFYCLDVEK